MSNTVERLVRAGVTAGVRGLNQISAAVRRRSAPHPYLVGIHTPLATEYTLGELAVSGTLPRELDGRYLRIGPNPFPLAAPNPAVHHWFTGDGMVHGVRIRDGRALWYRNRWIRSDAVAQGLGVEPVPAPPGRVRGTVNTNTIGHAGRTWALVEAGTAPVALSAELDTRAYENFADTLAGPYSAHPHRDPVTGELHAICYAGVVADKVWHTVVDVDGRVVREEPIAVQDGPCIHDCAITPHYVLVFDLPVTFSMKMLIAGRPFPYHWNPAHPARVGLLPRHGSSTDIRWYALDPCYAFHACNAFETADGSVVVDVIAHDRMFDNQFDGPDGSRMIFERWTLPADGTRVVRNVLDDAAQEFPRCDERRTGQPYRYAYTLALNSTPDRLDTRLFKHDLETGIRAAHDFGPGRHPGEFVFIPRDDETAEDAGWLMGLVIDVTADTTELIVLDAAHFTAPPQARVHLPHRIPPGFHGNWISTSAVNCEPG